MKSFEELLKELEEVVSRLESGQLSLEDSVKVYQEGMKLSVELKNRLDQAKACIVKKVTDNNETNL